MKNHRLLCALAVATVGSAGSMDAQVSSNSLQLWGGVGYGSFGCWDSFSCDAHVSGEARGAINGFAGIGGSITPFLTAGLELNARAKNEGTSTIRMKSASAVLVFYPAPSMGLHFKGSAGIAVSNHSGSQGDILLSDAQSTGTIGSLGIGYDLPLSSRISLTPGFELGAASIGGDGYRKMWETRLRFTLHSPTRRIAH
jgi:hypothetical protein